MDPTIPTRLGCIDDFISGIKSYYNNPDLSDVIIRVDGRIFHCHKFLLASSSDVFQTMLTGSQWVDSQQQEIVLEETPECTAVFGEFLKYLYCGQVSVDIRTIMPIFTLAYKYNIHRLRCQCERYMTEQIGQGIEYGQGNVNGALDWLSFAETYNLDQLVTHCYEVIACNLPKILDLKSWLGLSVDQMSRLLESPQLIVMDEYMLFKAIEKWFMNDLQKGGVASNLRKVLPFIRFAQMDYEQMLTIEKSEFRQIYDEHIKGYIQQGNIFHSLAAMHSMSSLFTADCYLARLYLAPPHCHVVYVHPSSTVMVNAMTKVAYQPKSGSPWCLLLLQNSKTETNTTTSSSNEAACERDRGMLTNVTYKLQAPNNDIGKSFKLAISAYDANDKFLNAVTKSGLVCKPDSSLTTNVTTIHSQAFLDKKGGKIKLGVVIQVF